VLHNHLVFPGSQHLLHQVLESKQNLLQFSELKQSILFFAHIIFMLDHMLINLDVIAYKSYTMKGTFSLFYQVLGGFDSSNYVTERKWAVASDGTQVPISVLYRKNLVKLDGSDPLLLYGYGSYEVTDDVIVPIKNICNLIFLMLDLLKLSVCLVGCY